MTELIDGLYRLGEPIADTKAPDGPIETRWERHKFNNKLVNPANRRKLSVIIVGTGLAGASAGATLGEAGYHVKSFCYQDSPRRPTRSPPRAVSTRRRTTRVTATRSTGSSTTRSRAATTAPARTTSTGSPRSARTSSTSASPRASPSPVSTAVCSTTAPSVASRSPGPSTPAARPASSSSSAPTRRSSGRSPRAPSRCTAGTRCSS